MIDHAELARLHCVFVSTSLDTHICMYLHDNDAVHDFKERLCTEHREIFPEHGCINISAVKVFRGEHFYQVADMRNMIRLFDGINDDWFITVDVVRPEESEVLTLMPPDHNISNETKSDLERHVDGDTRDHVVEVKDNPITEEAQDAEVDKKTSKKRKSRNLDANKSRKKSSCDVDQSVALATASKIAVDESHVVCGNAQVDAPSESSDVMGLIRKESNRGKKNDVSMEMNQQTSDEDRLCQEKIITINPGLVEGHTKGEEKDVQYKQPLEKAIETESATKITQKRKSTSSNDSNGSKGKLDDFTGAIEQDIGMGKTNVGSMGSRQIPDNQLTADLDRQYQEKDPAPTVELVDGLTGNEVKDVQNHPIIEEVMVTDSTMKKTKKKKMRSASAKKPSNDLNQSAIATNTSRAGMDENHNLSGEVQVDVPSAPFAILPKEKDTESGKKTPDSGESRPDLSAADKLQIDAILTSPANDLEVGSGLTATPAPEKKKKRRKSSKNHTKVTESVDLPEATQNEIEMGEKLVDKVESREDVVKDAVTFELANNVLVADLASIPQALVQEVKIADTNMGSQEENRTREHEVAEVNCEVDANDGISTKSMKKKTTKKAKILAKDTSVPSSEQVIGAATVESMKVADGEGPDNVIRNVLDSLQQNKETQESLGKIGKKSSKRSKKKSSLDMAKDQFLSVEVTNAAQEEAPPINNKKETDASLTPLKKGLLQSSEIINNDILTESDPHLKKSIEVADNTEKQIELPHGEEKADTKADTGDNFGLSQKKSKIVGDGTKQEQVGGAKSKKVKRSLDLHLGGSMDGSRKSMKPKERNDSSSRVQPASSGTSQLPSVIRNDTVVVSRSKKDRGGSRIGHSDASLKGTIHNKEAVTTKKTLFKDSANWNFDEDESKFSGASTKTPSGVLSDYSEADSDATSMSRKRGNNLFSRERAEGSNKFLGSSGNIKLQDILRSSSRYKKAKLTASQSQPDMLDDDSLALDCVPDSQAK